MIAQAISHVCGSPSGHSPGFGFGFGLGFGLGLEEPPDLPTFISKLLTVFPAASVAVITAVPFATAVIVPSSLTVIAAGLELVNLNGACPFITFKATVSFSANVAAAGTIHIFFDKRVSTAAKASIRQLQAVSIFTFAPDDCSSARVCAPVRDSSCAFKKATRPATNGVAIDVPERSPYLSCGKVDMIFKPGAAK